jgi:uncharacterized membrane protein YdbT with pleckstrin-like domain
VPATPATSEHVMSYVRHVIQPGEQIVRIGQLHWIIHRHAILVAILAILVFLFGIWKDDIQTYCWIAAAILAGIAFILFIPAWFRRMSTEIAVTNKRIIHKEGLINRHTTEMSIDKVATVVVDQSILGRLLDYGTIHVKGIGQGIENLRQIASPVELRNAIETR